MSFINTSNRVFAQFQTFGTKTCGNPETHQLVQFVCSGAPQGVRTRALLFLQGSASHGVESRGATIGRTARDTFGQNNDEPNSATRARFTDGAEFIKSSPYPQSSSDMRQTDESVSRSRSISNAANITQQARVLDR